MTIDHKSSHLREAVRKLRQRRRARRRAGKRVGGANKDASHTAARAGRGLDLPWAGAEKAAAGSTSGAGRGSHGRGSENRSARDVGRADDVAGANDSIHASPHTSSGGTGHKARRCFVQLLMVVVALGLVTRVVDLQVNRREFLRSEGDARYLKRTEIPAHRGKVVDRNGEPLAISAPVESVWADPSELEDNHRNWETLARILKLEASSLSRMVAQRSDRRFVFLKRQVEPQVADEIREAGISGVNLTREFRRYYPLGEAAGHVVGFTDMDDRGQEGMELAFDTTLRGASGAKRVLRDRLGREVEDVESITAPRPGQDLVLSLDRRVQNVAYRALLRAMQRHRALAGSVVVLYTPTGEVLAMVNQPSFNPNNRRERISDRHRNRAVTDVFEPGSAIKPFIVAAALDSGRFGLSHKIDTRPGYFKVGNNIVRDLGNYGIVDLPTLIRKSSNVGASKLSLALDPKDLWSILSRMGLGEATASGFPGESEGVLKHFKDWSDLDRATLSFGYGLSVTALQLAQAYSVFANDGRLSPVRFTRAEERGESHPIMKPDTARAIRFILESVVGEGGTAKAARIPGYRVGGKTGTARKSVPGGYAEDRYVAVFAGLAPLSDPRVVAVVIIDEPRQGGYYGGQVAAPIFAEVVAGTLRILGVAPDALASAPTGSGGVAARSQVSQFSQASEVRGTP